MPHPSIYALNTPTSTHRWAARTDPDRPSFEEHVREHHALTEAVEAGHHEEVAALLAAGANPNDVSLLGSAALVHAAAGGDLEMMESLVAAGADIDAQGPLVHAAQAGQYDAVAWLLAHGANPFHPNVEGFIASQRTRMANPRLTALVAAGERDWPRDQLDQDGWWALMDGARDEAGADDEGLLMALTTRLEACSASNLVRYVAIQDRLLARAYRTDLWEAARFLNGGASHDGFLYFRAWLLGQGRAVYDAALRDPNTLADAIVPDPAWEAEFEDVLGVPFEAYETVTGHPMPERTFYRLSLLGPPVGAQDLAPLRAADARLR